MARMKTRTTRLHDSTTLGLQASRAAGKQSSVRNANYGRLLLESNLHGRLSKSEDSSEAKSDWDSIGIVSIPPQGICRGGLGAWCGHWTQGLLECHWSKSSCVKGLSLLLAKNSWCKYFKLWPFVWQMSRNRGRSHHVLFWNGNQC